MFHYGQQDKKILYFEHKPGNRIDNFEEYRYILLLGKYEYCAAYKMHFIFSIPKVTHKDFKITNNIAR